MKCEHAEARILDFVTGERELAAEVETHLRGCETCRTALQDYRNLWEELGRLPAPEPGADLARRFLAGSKGDRSGRGGSAGERRWRGRARIGFRQIAAVAAGVLLGALGGYALASREAPNAPAGPAAGIERPTFLLLLREQPATFSVSEEELPSLVAEYAEWARELARRGHLVAAEKLANDGRTLLPTAEGVVVREGAGASAEGLVSGFFLVEAGGYAEATDLARGSPHLKYGGMIELRRVDAAN